MAFWVASVLLLELLLALWLLFRAGLLSSRPRLFLSLALLAGAFLLRAVCLDYVTLDYRDFLSRWVAFYRDNGGFRSFAYPLGNYNIPYLYFLCAFSYLPVNDLYLIKLLSIFFDVMLAWGSMRLLRCVRGESPRMELACFFTVLYLPTVILNGALWAQCDSIYVALAVLGAALAMEGKSVRSMLCFTLSFGFKLQAVFLLPILAVFWVIGKLRLRHLALFPLFYTLLVLPAVALGKPFVDTLLLYASQTGSIGSALNYNSPSVYAFFWRAQPTESASMLGIAAAFTWLGVLLLFAVFRREKLTPRAVLALLVLMAVGIPFLLPHMHDRYFFASDVLTVVLAYAVPACLFTAPLAQYASLLSYYAYLHMRYLLYVDHGARALIGVLVISFSLLLWETREKAEEEKTKKLEKLP